MGRDEATLVDIAKAAQAVLTFTFGLQREQFHGHDVIDWDEVWRTATIDLPVLLSEMDPLLPRQGSGQD